MKIKIHIKITPDDNTVDDIYIYIDFRVLIEKILAWSRVRHTLSSSPEALARQLWF